MIIVASFRILAAVVGILIFLAPSVSSGQLVQSGDDYLDPGEFIPIPYPSTMPEQMPDGSYYTEADDVECCTFNQKMAYVGGFGFDHCSGGMMVVHSCVTWTACLYGMHDEIWIACSNDSAGPPIDYDLHGLQHQHNY